MSWYGLLSILKAGADEDEQQRAMRPWACPNDGQPLTDGPHGTLLCRFDGWEYPRDWQVGQAPG